jgi:hypothetical protein
MSFKEGADTKYADSPDTNDTLYASFSFGSTSFSGISIPNSAVAVIPLTSSNGNLTWTWGMRYTNLTALWWHTSIDPANQTYNVNPVALSTYDELTFTYTLTIDQASGKVIVQENHVIGRMRDLIVGITYYNSTGHYGLLGYIDGTTIYDYLQANNYKMSIVNYQTSIVANTTTYSKTASGQNITGTENTAVSDSLIDTYTANGAKIFTSDFGSKQQYKLYNYTADPTETSYDTYNSTTRTAPIGGFAGNTGLFAYQIAFASYLPLTTYHMCPALYQQAKESITNMTRADYFYIVSYPTYSGYKINHDPTITAYAKLTANDSADAIFWIIGIVVVAVLFVVVAWFLFYQVKGKKSAF